MEQQGSQRLRGILAVGTAATLWGTVGPLVQLYPAGTAFQYATMRNLFGDLALWILVMLQRQRTRYTRADLRPILIGAVGTACFMPFYAMGFERTGVAVASVLAIGAAPLFTGVVGRIVFGRVPGRQWFLGTGLAVAGLVGLNWPSGGTTVNLVGVCFALGAAVGYALQATGMELMSQRHSPFQSVAPIWTTATILQAPICLGRDFGFLSQPALLAGTVYGGVLTVAITFAMFTYGLSRIGSSTAVTVGLMEPITAATLGVLVLGEHLSLLGAAGIVLVLAGLVVVSRPERMPAQAILVEP